MKAEWNFSLAGLMEKLRDPGHRPNYVWIRQRINRTWPMWLRSAENLASASQSTGNLTLSARHRKRVRYAGQCIGDLVVWHCGNSVGHVGQVQTQLVPGWVTVFGQANFLDILQATPAQFSTVQYLFVYLFCQK